jgi:hypothetical protein
MEGMSEVRSGKGSCREAAATLPGCDRPALKTAPKFSEIL